MHISNLTLCENDVYDCICMLEKKVVEEESLVF